MKKKFQSRAIYYPLLLIAVIAFLCTACGGTTDAQKKTIHPSSVTTTTPLISAEQISTTPIVYVAMGASDAVGVGTNQPGAEGYVPLVADHLTKNSHMVNLGVSGIHLHEAIIQELPIVLSTAPQLITIWLVANDFVAGVKYNTYMVDLDTLLKQLHLGTQARIVMANLPDLTLLPALSGANAAQKVKSRTEIQRWNAKISEIAATYDVTIVDLFSKNSQLTAHPEYISGDGFHPSPAGYVQLADFFWNAINKN